MYLLFVVEKCVFCSFEYTCAVLENMHVRQGRNYRQCSQRGRFVGKKQTLLCKFFRTFGSSKCCKFNATVIKDTLFYGQALIPYGIYSLKMANLSLSWIS